MLIVFRPSIDPTEPFAFTRSTFGGVPFGSVRRLHVCFPDPGMNSASFVAMLQTMRGSERLEMERNTEGPLTCWAEEDDQAEICPVIGTLTIETTDVDIEGAEHWTRWLEQARGVLMFR